MADGTSASSNTRTTVILVLVYVALIGLSFVGAYNFTVWGTNDSPKNFAAVVTVCLTAASAIMGVIVSFLSLQKNQKSAIDLETLKSELQTNVLKQKIWTDLQFEHEKSKTTAEGTAYAKLWTSTDSAYLSLAKLETGSWKSEDKTLMDGVLLEAHSQLVYARSPDHQTLWLKVRQRARDISERAAKVDTSQQPKLWQDNVVEFAGLCTQFKDVASAEINRPPPREEPVVAHSGST
jgi:hypothetical protein